MADRAFACPNPNDKYWRQTVEKVGIFEAYRIFIRNGYDVPKFVFKTINDVYKYLDFNVNRLHVLSKEQKDSKRYFIPYGRDLHSYYLNSNLVKSEVERINQVYNGLLIVDGKTVTQPDPRTPGRNKIEWVEVNEGALAEHYRVYEESKRNVSELVSEEGDVLPDYEQRKIYNDRLTPENREDFEQKKKVMLKSFPRIKEVIEDYEISVSGLLEANGTIIRVNPNYYTTDTIGHEFGHLLIDLIGGLENPLIRKAVKELEDTDIWNETKNRYSDLFTNDFEKFQKEVLAQVVGEETASIFKTEKEQSWLVNWLNRFYERLKSLLGIERNTARALARKILAGKELKLPGNITESYEQRTVQEDIQDIEEGKIVTPKTKIEKLRDRMVDVLETKHKIYKKRDIKQKITLLRDTLAKIKDLDNDPIEALRLFQDFSIQQTELVKAEYLAAKRQSELYNKNLTLRQLSKWYNYLSGFSILSEFIDLIKDIETDLSDRVSKDKIESVIDINKLHEALDTKDLIEKVYKEKGVELVANFLSPYSKHIEAQYREDLERKYNNLPKEEKQAKTLQEYLNENIDTHKESLTELTRRNIITELTKASRDINMLQRWIDNVIDSPDVVVSSLASAFNEADFKSRQRFIEVKNTVYDAVKKLEDYNKSNVFTDSKGIYDFMLEKDDKGNYTQNIIDIYKSSMWDNYNNFKASLEEKEMPYDKMQEQLKLWKLNNMPIDWHRFNKVKAAFFNILLEQGYINKEQKKNLEDNDDWHTEIKRPIETIVGDEAAEIIEEFYRDNLWKYRLPKTIWRNPQWLNLVTMAGGDVNSPVDKQIDAVKENKSKDPRIEFYNTIRSLTDEIQKGVPYGHRLHTRMPSVLKTTSERLTSENKLSDAFNHAVSSNIKVLIDESERGEQVLTDESGNPVNFIPVYYTANLKKMYEKEYEKLSDSDKKKETKEQYATRKADQNQSYDVASIYTNYFKSAIEYREKANILPEMEMARYLVNNREVIERDSKGNVITTNISKLKTKVLTKEGSKSNVASQLNDWFEALMYGQKEKNEGTLFGGRVDAAKFADMLNKFTALNLLSLNFVQGTANVMLGSTNQFIESFGKQFYSQKDLAKANLVYGKNLPGIMGDVGSIKKHNKISLLLEKFDILNEYNTPEFRKNSVFRQLLTSNTLFFTSHAGEHFMQTKVLLAMLNRLPAKNKEGEVIGNMLDMLKVKNGKIIFEDDKGNPISNFSTTEQAIFEGKVRRVLSSLHGEYTESGRIALQRYALGRMAYMFRKFVVTGVRRRYQKKQVNNSLGDWVEGNYRTTGRFIVTLGKDLRNFQFSLMATDWNSLTAMEKANIRKTMIELSFLIASSVLANILINLEGDDDDEWLVDFMTYEMLRYKTELWFFANPSEAMKILQSPAASMSVIENTIKLFSQMLPPDFEGFERYERGSWKGELKLKKTAINFVPVMKQIYRLKYIEDQSTLFKN